MGSIGSLSPAVPKLSGHGKAGALYFLQRSGTGDTRCVAGKQFCVAGKTVRNSRAYLTRPAVIAKKPGSHCRLVSSGFDTATSFWVSKFQKNPKVFHEVRGPDPRWL